MSKWNELFIPLVLYNVWECDIYISNQADKSLEEMEARIEREKNKCRSIAEEEVCKRKRDDVKNRIKEMDK